eukprot:CFRG6382T1
MVTANPIGVRTYAGSTICDPSQTSGCPTAPEPRALQPLQLPTECPAIYRSGMPSDMPFTTTSRSRTGPECPAICRSRRQVGPEPECPAICRSPRQVGPGLECPQICRSRRKDVQFWNTHRYAVSGQFITARECPPRCYPYNPSFRGETSRTNYE